MSSKLSNEYATLLDEIEPEDEGEIAAGVSFVCTLLCSSFHLVGLFFYCFSP
jgi:hypothetical protein